MHAALSRARAAPLWIMLAAVTMPRSALGQASAYNDAIFKVHAGNCEREPRSTTQSGFLTLVDDQLGVVTALHGIVGCDTGRNGIRASNEAEDLRGLRITKVDVKRDLAFLRVGDTNVTALQPSPLMHELYANNEASPEIELSLIGYPHGVQKQLLTPVRLQPKDPIAPLRTIAGAAIRTFARRMSPHPNTDVLITDKSDPGHSGAPLLFDQRVAGVGLGGVPGSRTLAWAIPYAAGLVEWRSRRLEQEELERLADERSPRTVNAVSDWLTPSQPWSLGANFFTSLGPQNNTTLPGEHQGRGGAVAVKVPVRARLEVGIEGAITVFESLTSAEVGSSVEDRSLRAHLISATIGRPLRLGDSARLIPVAGAGVAVLQSTRLTRTATNISVQRQEEGFVEVVPALTAGLDFRFRLGQPLWIVASYRLDVLAGETEISASRFRHRAGLGVQWNFGDWNDRLSQN